MRFTARSSHILCYLLAAILTWLSCFESAEAHRFKRKLADTNMFCMTKRHSKSCGSQRVKIMGGENLSAMKDVEKASTSYPPYLICSKKHGERTPRTRIYITATPVNYNMHYKDGKKQPHSMQGGPKNKDHYQYPLTEQGKDGPIPPDKYRFIPKMPPVPVQMGDMKGTNLLNYLKGFENPQGNKRGQSNPVNKSPRIQEDADEGSAPQGNFQKGGNQQQAQAQGASEACADAFDPCWDAMLELHMMYLINVANENAGQACGGREPVKVHENAVWMVMQMYKKVYLNIALLLLLPGAVLTQVKGMVSSGILHSQNDEDAQTPFVGILRGMVALFLIPCTQLIVSYSADIGNSMNYEVKRHLNVGILTEWANEQIFRAPEDAKQEAIMHPSMKAVQGKMSEGSEKESGVEAQSLATIMLQTMANLSGMSAAFGLVMLSAFQITMMCYLFLLGPIAAAFYAWPATVGMLFNRVFAIWVDAVVNVGLWRFMWCTVLLAAQTRIEWLGEMGQYDPYCEWELIMFVSFMTILTYVPFNPFDFKPGEMVAQIMQKAEQAVNETSTDAAQKKGGK